MRLILSITLGCLLCTFSHANDNEITQLMAFIAQSDCTYQRNGSDYSGKDALEHIKKKYDYFEDDIKNAEDFIRLSATKSTMSGKAYTVKCPNQAAITSEQWLLRELKRIRQTQ